MRALVVDDDATKVKLVVEFLVSLGVRDEDVTVAKHAAEARILLAENVFDVMLVDVLLPARKDATPLGETSVELLRQIIDDGTSRAPRHIVGMTASSEALEKFGSDFRNLVLQVLQVTPETDLWKESLQSFVSFVRHAEHAREAFEYDICVVNALRCPELEAVYSTWPLKLETERLLSRSITYRAGTLSLGNRTKRVACAHLSQMGPVAAVHAVESILSAFKPRVIVMTGICGGFADHVRIGDVVVADKSWDWQAGKWAESGTLLSAIDQKDGSTELVAMARGADSRLAEFQKRFTGTKPKELPRLIVGPMVTGSSVVASLDIQKAFRNQHRKMVAVDMECYGLYYACINHSGPQAKVICIKTVSDLADRGKADDFQLYGSHMSACVGLETLCRYFADLG